MALILDTGPLYAALDRSDDFHEACRKLIEASSEVLIIPAPVLVEVDYWIHKRMDSSIFDLLLEDILSGAFVVEDLIEEDYLRVRTLTETYRDGDVGFVDAAVLAVVERLDEPKLATLDRRHFSFLRPRHVPALQLLP